MNAPNSPNVPKPLKILLADDSANIHRAVALALRKEPYELIYCDNGQDALRIIREQNPAIVLADLDMPGPTGKEICQKIKSTPGMSQIKVILLCGSFDQVEDQKLDALAADGRLWKPFESHVLLSLLSTVLRAPTHRPADRTLVEVPTQKEEFSDPLRELTTEMIRQTFNQASQHEQLSESAPAPNPWDYTPEIEPQIPLKIETTQSLPRDISPFEKTLPPEEFASPPVVKTFNETTGESRRDEIKEDIWAPNSLPPLTPSSDMTQPLDRSEGINSDLSFFREQGDVTEQAPAFSAPEWNAPTMNIDRTAFQAKAPTIAAAVKPPLPRAVATAVTGVNPESLRQMVREEIQKSFDGWFRERLEQKLRDVMNQIDKD